VAFHQEQNKRITKNFEREKKEILKLLEGLRYKSQYDIF
jgi:hypothetical protein